MIRDDGAERDSLSVACDDQEGRPLPLTFSPTTGDEGGGGGGPRGRSGKGAG